MGPQRRWSARAVNEQQAGVSETAKCEAWKKMKKSQSLETKLVFKIVVAKLVGVRLLQTTMLGVQNRLKKGVNAYGASTKGRWLKARLV